MLIGRNGSGKSTIGDVLEIFRDIAQGETRVEMLVKPRLLSLLGDPKEPMRFEVDVLLQGRLYRYKIAFELPGEVNKFRILEEGLTVDEEVIFNRKQAQITFFRGMTGNANFVMDTSVIALVTLHVASEKDPLSIFRSWLEKIIVISPIPTHMNEVCAESALYPERNMKNFVDWLARLLELQPAAHSILMSHLLSTIPDLKSLYFKDRGSGSKSLWIQYEDGNAKLSLPFDTLSDGEKCFFIGATVLAVNEMHGPFLCFWDEPDNFMSVSEVGHFILSLRRGFKIPSQVLVTSHNMEAINKFHDDNTWLLTRNTALYPPKVSLLGDVRKGPPGFNDLTTALILGDLF